jgi:transcriptional regulator with XRE-family HTH domain
VKTFGEVRQQIGANIRRLRKKAGMSQKKLGEKATLHPVYVSHVERGTKAASVETIWKISKALRVAMSTLFRGV